MAIRFAYTEFQSPPSNNRAQIIWDHIAVGEQADQLGFDVFTCLEHDWFEQFAIMPDPLQVFAILSQRARNIRFRALCHTLPLHNPVVLAGQIALADILLDGRFEVGLGRGHTWLQDPANIVLDESVERYPECVDILLKRRGRRTGSRSRASTTPARTCRSSRSRSRSRTRRSGRSGRAPSGSSGRCGTAGGRARRARAERRVRRADQQVPRRLRGAWRRVKFRVHQGGEPRRGRREGDRGGPQAPQELHRLQRLTDGLDRSPEGKKRLIEARYEFYAADDFPNTRNLSYEQLLDLEIFSGSPDKVADQLVDLLERFRFDEFLLISNYGGNACWQAMKTQELFAKKIATRMRKAAEKMRKKSAVAAA